MQIPHQGHYDQLTSMVTRADSLTEVEDVSGSLIDTDELYVSWKLTAEPYLPSNVAKKNW